MDLLQVGARIRAAREAQGLTQAGLASAVGVSRSAVAQWETGRSGQVGTNLAAIARALEVGVEHLLLGGGAGRVAAEFGLLPDEAGDGGGRRMSGDEMALVRLYRESTMEDRAFLLRLARRLSRLEKET
jgi:transcriptional regulator with XRE-family HTH domain